MMIPQAELELTDASVLSCVRDGLLIVLALQG